MKILISFFLFANLFSACSSPKKETFDQFHGYWKMKGFWQKDSTLKWKEAKWMKNGNGYLLYDGKGHMSIHITPKDYAIDSTLTKESFMENPEILTLSNYVYTGRYSTNGKDSITHYRLSHGNPTYNFTPSEKRYELIKDTLCLYSTVAGKDCKIKWTRIQ